MATTPFRSCTPTPPKGRDVSEDTQVELVYSEHSWGQVEPKAISLLYAIFVIFNIFGFIEIKRKSFKLLILCVVILKHVKIKYVDIARHPYRLLIWGYKGFIYYQPLIRGHRDFNFCIYICGYKRGIRRYVINFILSRI